MFSLHDKKNIFNILFSNSALRSRPSDATLHFLFFCFRASLVKCSVELRQWCICKKCKGWSYESWSLQSILERLCSLKQLSNGVLKGNKTEELERRKLAAFFSCIRFQQLVIRKINFTSLMVFFNYENVCWLKIVRAFIRLICSFQREK